MTELAREMNFTVDEINHIRLESPNSLTAQSFMLLKKWVSREGKNATSKALFNFYCNVVQQKSYSMYQLKFCLLCFIFIFIFKQRMPYLQS